jgi:flavin-dependent dehydrogenase
VIKVKDKYDVIVIGAGIGGLTCSAFLAKEGLSALVSEQGGMLYNILEELGLEHDIEFIELAPFTRIIGSDYEEYKRKVGMFIPKPSSAWDKFR